MDHHLIDKYLEGKASETETKEVFAWISESPENHKEFIQSKKAWALAARAQEDQE